MKTHASLKGENIHSVCEVLSCPPPFLHLQVLIITTDS